MSEAQREMLTVVARSHSAPHRQVQRAKALLQAADGVANTRIAEQVGVTPTTVASWRARFTEEGVSKLGRVRAGRGRKPEIPQAKIDEIVELTRGRHGLNSVPLSGTPVVRKQVRCRGRVNSLREIERRFVATHYL